MDINKEIQIISDRVIAEKLPAMVEASATKMLESIISDIFSGYSPMAKQIKTKIEEKLNVNLQEYDLIDYNALIAKTINDNIIQQVNLQPIADLTRKAIGFINKKEIKLSEIVEMFKDASKADSNDSDGAISLYVQHEEKHRWYEVELDIRAGIQANECGIRFLIDDKTNRIFSFKCKDYWTNLNPITPSKIISLSHLEHEIFRLYSAQVRIEVDETDFDVEWCKYD